MQNSGSHTCDAMIDTSNSENSQILMQQQPIPPQPQNTHSMVTRSTAHAMQMSALTAFVEPEDVAEDLS